MKDIKHNKININTNCSEKLLTTISAGHILQSLHEMIDKKFNREDRSKFVSPNALKNTLTLWYITNEFIDYEPKLVSRLLKELVSNGSVITNLDIDNVFPFDAYFIPKTELIDDKDYNNYIDIKRKIIN